MTGQAALDELVNNGWFERFETPTYGIVYRAVRPPSKKDLHYYVNLLHIASAYTVGLHDKPAPIRLISGLQPSELYWMPKDA